MNGHVQSPNSVGNHQSCNAKSCQAEKRTIKMSPTNHTLASTDTVNGYAATTLSSFPFNATKSPVYQLISSKTSSRLLHSPKSSIISTTGLEPPAFSCIGHSVHGRDSANGFTKLNDNNNLNELESVTLINPANESGQIFCNSCNNDDVRNGKCSMSCGRSEDEADIASNNDENGGSHRREFEDHRSRDQKEEENQYFGPRGFSIWYGGNGPGSWVRKMGYAERFMTNAADFGVMSTVYNLWFESEHVITLDMIEKTCLLVARKMPHLRLCVGNRNGELWFREMEEIKIDIKEHVTNDIHHSAETFLKKKFDLENGPLWFVRYINIDTNDTTNTPVVNHNYRSRFVIIFGFHHNFSDGTTNMQFCNVFLKVLNDVVLNRPTDMKVETKLAESFHDRLADEMRNECRWRNNLWLLYIFCKRFYRGILAYGYFLKNYTTYYRQPAEMEASTRHLPEELDEETTGKLLKRCREEKASLNSAFTAAANIALYKMILIHDCSVEATDFGGIQTLNMRRYWSSKERENSCGCHISTLDVNIPTVKSDVTDNWGYARRIQGIMDYELNDSKRGIRMLPIGERLRLILYTNYFMEWAGISSTNDNHYCITNMGNLSSIFPGTGEAVEVTKVSRSVSCHYMPNLCQHTLHTFRGKLYYSLDYYTQKMEREDAKVYAKTIMETLRAMANMPSSMNGHL